MSLMKEIEDTKDVTKKMLRDATRAVKAYRDAVAWFPAEEEKANGLAEHEEFLKQVVVTAVAQAKKRPKENIAAESPNSPASTTTWGFARLQGEASGAGDIGEIWALYIQLFEVVPGEALVPQMDLDDRNPSGQDDWQRSDDLGVEGFSNMDDAQLNHFLQFLGGRPALFAEFRSQGGKCAWDKAVSSDFIKGNADMQPLSLLWHHRVGAAALADKIWLKKENSGGVPGVLVADEVEMAAGRGKPTGVTVDLNKTNVRKAPMLEERPFFPGQATIPCLPQSDGHPVHEFNVDSNFGKDEGQDTCPNARNQKFPHLMSMGKRKILVYTEFPMMVPLLSSVLKLHNIVPLTLNGSHGVDERNEIVKKFNADPSARVLLFSSVGAVGLNLMGGLLDEPTHMMSRASLATSQPIQNHTSNLSHSRSWKTIAKRRRSSTASSGSSSPNTCPPKSPPHISPPRKKVAVLASRASSSIVTRSTPRPLRSYSAAPVPTNAPVPRGARIGPGFFRGRGTGNYARGTPR
ncbi:hypothetical protein DFH29DRAFT_1006383 [Suillus ampliporus]|nr:hypothetical protein DFH29DRAFT_1006383 [Suillus ampliporus]